MAADADGRFGRGRLGGSTETIPPRTGISIGDRGAEAIWSAVDIAGAAAAMASVVRSTMTSTPSARVTTAMVLPGEACSRTEVSTRSG